MNLSVMIIGVSNRTASADVRQRFAINESRRYEALVELGGAEGIDEIAVLSTPDLTDFLVAASDAGAASNEIVKFLTRRYGLRMGDWEKFYRKLDEPAVAHLLEVISAGEPPSAALHAMMSAWSQAQRAGASRSCLDTIFAQLGPIARRLEQASPDAVEQVRETAARELLAELSRVQGQPRAAALRCRLEQLARLELEELRNDPFAADTDREQLMQALAMHIVDRVTRTVIGEANRLPAGILTDIAQNLALPTDALAVPVQVAPKLRSKLWPQN